MPGTVSMTFSRASRIFWTTGDRTFARRALVAAVRNAGLGGLLVVGSPLLAIIEGGMTIWTLYKVFSWIRKEQPDLVQTSATSVEQAFTQAYADDAGVSLDT